MKNPEAAIFPRCEVLGSLTLYKCGAKGTQKSVKTNYGDYGALGVVIKDYAVNRSVRMEHQLAGVMRPVSMVQGVIAFCKYQYCPGLITPRCPTGLNKTLAPYQLIRSKLLHSRWCFSLHMNYPI